MSSRYGRNQKRRHLTEIAALQARIEELMGPWERARPGDIPIDPARVMNTREVKEDRKYDRVSYELELTVLSYDGLLDQLRGGYDTFYSYGGYAWKLDMASLHRAPYTTTARWEYGHNELELRFVNVLRPPYKRDLLSPGI